ncbi:hypothetical protein [Gordonia rhizosphera]|uniref:Uncharacterized protein n=1 Tax=Gordonia rhizosphera NBRC 16068 TaxID=1108045 RepID=K6W9D9_9ACTN|nr:hypothetical protein [Gordonia rhizosphera]GAB90366.1 hypothetical protein GORHZ_098_00140 [Gordonia rhizosphera NBRC 16068]
MAYLSAVQVVTIVAFIAAGSGADGPGFRAFSVVIAGAILAAGSQASIIGEGGVTPWIGILERVSFYGASIWIVGLALVLLRTTR